MSSTPPLRSSPRRVFFGLTAPGMPMITSSETRNSPATTPSTSVLRRRSVIGRSSANSLLLGGQDEQQPAIVVVGGEHVRLRAGRDVAFARDPNRHLQRPHAPLEDLPHRVIAVFEPQADHLLLLQTGEGERVLPAPDHPPLPVAHEEGGVRCRIVVVEQFKQEGEAALRAAPPLAGEAEVAIELATAVPAVWTDERVGHGQLQTTQGAPRRRPVTVARCARCPPHTLAAQNRADPPAEGGSSRRWAN